jgi:hypothetical protein
VKIVVVQLVTMILVMIMMAEYGCRDHDNDHVTLMHFDDGSDNVFAMI